MSHQSELISEDINEYLKQHEQKELLRLLTCGSVDDGKSTLIGRLLHDSQMIYEDQLEAIKKDSVKSGTNEGEIDLALLVDGLQAEREQGITIDVAYRYFSTARRKFIIADTPGHEQYTRNMATGASTADLAIILIDARQGVLTQTKRHSFIASLLGIKHVVVAINKMDLVDYSEERFNEIKDEYLAFADQLDLQDIKLVPISALKGTNVVSVSEEHTPWYQGQPLMEMLETVQVDGDRNFDDFRLPIQYVNRPNLNFRGFCGTIASGIVKPGDQVLALPSGKSSTVKSIVTYEGELDQAFADQAVTLTLNDEIDISRGDMLVKPDNQPETSNAFSAHIVWMIEDALKPGKLFDIKLGSKVASGSIKDIQHVIDVNTLEQSSADALELNSIALCNLHLNQTLAFDPYKKNRATGAFIIIDRLTNVTVGAGMIHEKIEDHSASDWEPVSDAERHARLDQEPSIVLCQGEAAEALAQAAERKLYNLGRTAVLVTPHMAESAEQAQVIATALKQAGLIAIASSLVDASLADHAISANNDTDIIDAIASLDA